MGRVVDPHAVESVAHFTPVAIALGSNLGDRRSHLDFAAVRLQTLLTGLRLSRYYDTVPVGMSGPQPMFLNAAAVGEAALAPRALLEALLDIERECGRDRANPSSARTLDLDLVLFGGAVIDEPGLIVPHPRFRERRFVLDPLADIAGEMVDPVSGETIAALRGRRAGG